MNVEYINPFIESLADHFLNKLKTEVDQGDLCVSKGEVNVREFASFLGYQGAVTGIVAVFFPVTTALAIASQIEKREIKVVDSTVTEYLGEVVSKIAKVAKEKFPEGGGNISQTGYAVLRGSEFSEKYPGGVWLEVPFKCSLGDFKLRIALRAS